MVKIEVCTSLAKTSKNKQISLEKLQSVYQRMIFTWVCQQCQEVSRVRRQVFCKPHMASGWNHYFAPTPLSNISMHWGSWLIHGWGKRPCSDLQEHWRWCCDTTRVETHDCTRLSSTCPPYLEPSIVRFWFIPTEVTKGRQHVVLNVNETMESLCVQAQKQAQQRKGGWPCWALCG